MKRRLGAALATLPLVAFVYAPLAAPGFAWVAFDAPRWQALLITVAWAAGVAVATTALAAAAALALWTRGRAIAILAFLAAPLPAYLHALAWLPWLRGPWLAPRGAGPWLMAGWVMVFACLPLAFAVVWLRLRALDGRLADAGMVHQSPNRVLAKVVLPLWMPALAAAACLVFLLSLTEYAVPSLFAADPWTLEIFTDFSARHDAARAWGLSLPLVACALPALAALLAYARSAPAQGRPPADAPLRWWMTAAAALLVLQWGVPLAMLTQRAAAAPLSSFGPNVGRDVLTSYSVATLAAAIAVAAAAPLAWWLARETAVWPWVLAVLPLAVPAPLAGVGLVTVWNRDGVPPLYGTAAMLVLAALARFLPAAVLVLAAVWKRVDRRLLDAARVHGSTRGVLLRVAFPLFAPGAAAAAAVVFILSLGELGATLVVAPPGGGTLSIRLYNYLHYGAAGPVAWLALMMTVGSLAVGWPALAWMARRGRNA